MLFTLFLSKKNCRHVEVPHSTHQQNDQEEYSSDNEAIAKISVSTSRSTRCSTADVPDVPTIASYEELLSCGIKSGVFAATATVEKCQKKVTIMHTPQIDFPIISTETAMKQLRKSVSSDPSCKRSVFKNLRIQKEDIKYCYKVDLDTFVEKRFISWQPVSATLPSSSFSRSDYVKPWDIPFVSSENFVDSFDECIVPNSESNHPCLSCSSTSRNLSATTCTQCNGSKSISAEFHVRSEHTTLQHAAILNHSSLSMKCIEEANGLMVYCVKGNEIESRDVFVDSGMNKVVKELLESVKKEVNESNAIIVYQQLFVSIVPIRSVECISGTDHFTVIVYDHDKKMCCNEFPRYKSKLMGQFIRVFSV